MMPAAHRHLDLCSGHICYPPRPNATASNNVFVNNKGWHRKTDLFERHKCSEDGPAHSGMTIEGANTVFVNNLSVSRIGDKVSCGSVCMEGSNNVFAEG